MTATAITRKATYILCALAMCSVTLSAPILFSKPAFADPPRWAPAHGYKGKHKKKYKRKHSRERDHRDRYQPSETTAHLPRITLDRCNRELIGGAIGGAAGGYIGSTIGKGDAKLAATAIGAIIGALVGGNIGRAMDEIDQTCVGRVLETARTGQTVRWRNPDSGSRYEVTPVATNTSDPNRYCRDYTARSTIGGRTETTRGIAFRQHDGTWKTIN
ncbi:MAG: glycine zipper 2TM domain-containing protein [Rhodospirillales bacterium]|nr:glycine zipper 2TM domain-containing protein [Rhodospirillales bacterium]